MKTITVNRRKARHLLRSLKRDAVQPPPFWLQQFQSRLEALLRRRGWKSFWIGFPDRRFVLTGGPIIGGVR
jgi:hypothetical protein